jgi:hypothetical protein
MALCDALAAYNLYVDQAANPLLADGSIAHPYVRIQDAIDHAFNDSLPVNQSSPSVYVNAIGSVNAYIENLIVEFHNDSGIAHSVQNLTIKGESFSGHEVQLVTHDSSFPALTVFGAPEASFTIIGINLTPSVSETATKGISVPATSLAKLEILNCNLDGFNTSLHINTGDHSPIDSLVVANSVFHVSIPPDFSEGHMVAGYYGVGTTIIRDNVVTSNGLIESNCVAYVYGVNASIINNRFENMHFNLFGDPSDVRIAKIDGNEFLNSVLTVTYRIDSQITNNTFYKTSLNPAALNAIRLQNTNPNIDAIHVIRNNTFWNIIWPITLANSSTQADYLRVNASLIKNSFVNCSGIARIYCHVYTGTPTNRISVYRDNLYYGTSDDLFTITDTNGQPVTLSGDNRIPVSYSHFSNTISIDPSINLDIYSVTYGPPLDFDK